jgi:hypothetical protein
MRVHVAGHRRGSTARSMDILHKAKGDYLDQVNPNQKVLKVIRQGRLVLVIGGQESRN